MKTIDAALSLYDEMVESLGNYPRVDGSTVRPKPVSEEQIADLEASLGAALPADYRQFLLRKGPLKRSWQFWDKSPAGQWVGGEFNLVFPKRHPEAGTDERFRGVYWIWDHWDNWMIGYRFRPGHDPELILEKPGGDIDDQIRILDRTFADVLAEKASWYGLEFWDLDRLDVDKIAARPSGLRDLEAIESALVKR